MRLPSSVAGYNSSLWTKIDIQIFISTLSCVDDYIEPFNGKLRDELLNREVFNRRWGLDRAMEKGI
jgi:hypothetical protein